MRQFTIFLCFLYSSSCLRVQMTGLASMMRLPSMKLFHKSYFYLYVIFDLLLLVSALFFVWLWVWWGVSFWISLSFMKSLDFYFDYYFWLALRRRCVTALLIFFFLKFSLIFVKHIRCCSYVRLSSHYWCFCIARLLKSIDKGWKLFIE